MVTARARVMAAFSTKPARTLSMAPYSTFSEPLPPFLTYSPSRVTSARPMSMWSRGMRTWLTMCMVVVVIRWGGVSVWVVGVEASCTTITQSHS